MEHIARHRTAPLLAVLLSGLLAAALLLAALRPPGEAVTCAAETRWLVPVGQTVGIKLFSHGVMVVGLDEVDTASGSVSPARESGWKVGDIITQLDGQQVNSIEEVEALLRERGGEALAVTALRQGRQLELTTEAAACLSDGSYKLGAWVRDSMAGIGTVTWYDPESKTFCALGHGINDVDTSVLMPLKDGGIMASSVTGVLKGKAGEPGQLHGTFDLTSDLGSLTANTDCGVFGTLYGDTFSGEAIPVAGAAEVKTGAAAILCNIDGTQVQEYSVEILRIYPSGASTTRNFMVQVTDEALLEATGGIVQGMSGSPVLQDGKLVGAVTHVLVGDPTRGYGIFAQNTLSSMS